MRINKKDFREWLKKGSENVVGSAGNAYWCPLACYIRQELDADVSVFGKVIMGCKNGSRCRIETKPWMKKFIVGVDELKPGWGPVKGKEALEVLDG